MSCLLMQHICPDKIYLCRSFQKFCVHIYCNNKTQDNNTTNITECLHMCFLLSVITSTVHTFFPSAAAALYLSLLRRCKQAATAVLILSSDSNCLLKDVLSHLQTTSNHIGRDLESREDVPKTPSPEVGPDFSHHDGDEVLHILEQNDTMLKQFRLLTVKRPPHFILQECAVILANNSPTNWYRMVMYKSISAKEHDVHDFQSTLTAPCNFLPRLQLGTPVNILSSQLRVK